MEAGQEYSAKIREYGVGETKTGLTKVWVQFANEAGDTVNWTGVMKPGKAEEITLNTLKTMGFAGDFEGLNTGHTSGALNTEKTFNIVTEENSFSNAEGETVTYTRVKWVNDPDAPRKGQERMAPEKVHIKKASFVNSWKAFEASKKQEGKLPPQVPETKKAVNTDDIPF